MKPSKLCLFISAFMIVSKLAFADSLEQIIWEGDINPKNYWSQEHQKYRFIAKNIPYQNKALIGSTWIGKLVLPSQLRDISGFNFKELVRGGFPNSKRDVYLNEISVQTQDDAHLDTLEVIPKNFHKLPLSRKKYIVRFLGNGDLFELLADDSVQTALDLNVGYVTFNYRGVGKSTKPADNYRDLVLDGLSQVERLLQLGIIPENIILDGHSLGGGVGTYVASFLHSRGKRVRLFVDRSFARIDSAASHMVGWLGGFALTHSPWSLSPEQEIIKLPEEAFRVANSRDDEVINYEASMTAFLEKQNASNTMKFNSLIGKRAHSQDRNILISEEDQNLSLKLYFYDFVTSAGH